MKPDELYPSVTNLREQVRKLKEERQVAIDKKDNDEMDRIAKELNRIARQLGEYITYK